MSAHLRPAARAPGGVQNPAAIGDSSFTARDESGCAACAAARAGGRELA
jgi:hypothetical protein